MEEKKETGALIKALILAQAEFAEIKKEKVNPYFKSKYAPLDTVIAATAPALRKHGLAIVQTFEPGPLLRTTLYHISGESITGTQPLSIDKNTPQELASASTYARRYGWQAIIGITADEDDDGNGAEKKGDRPGTPEPVKTKAQYAAAENDKTRTQAEEKIKKLMASTDADVVQWRGNYLTAKNKTVDQLDTVEKLELINMVNTNIAKRKDRKAV